MLINRLLRLNRSRGTISFLSAHKRAQTLTKWFYLGHMTTFSLIPLSSRVHFIFLSLKNLSLRCIPLVATATHSQDALLKSRWWKTLYAHVCRTCQKERGREKFIIFPGKWQGVSIVTHTYRARESIIYIFGKFRENINFTEFSAINKLPFLNYIRFF